MHPSMNLQRSNSNIPMSASWEILASQQVLVCILTREVTSVAWSFGFRNLIIPGQYTGLSGLPFAEARDTGCLKCLELGYEWLFFLDDDVIPPPDTILRLMAHKQPIISGVYHRRANPILPCMLKEVPGGRQWITSYPSGAFEVDYVGAGCLLIHHSVLQKLPPISPTNRYFEWRVNRYELPEPDRMSEDFSFCKHARGHGYKILVDGSIQCKHAGLSQSVTPGVLQPLELL